MKKLRGNVPSTTRSTPWLTATGRTASISTFTEYASSGRRPVTTSTDTTTDEPQDRQLRPEHQRERRGTEQMEVETPQDARVDAPEHHER